MELKDYISNRYKALVNEAKIINEELKSSTTLRDYYQSELIKIKETQSEITEDVKSLFNKFYDVNQKLHVVSMMASSYSSKMEEYGILSDVSGLEFDYSDEEKAIIKQYVEDVDKLYLIDGDRLIFNDNVDDFVKNALKVQKERVTEQFELNYKNS